MEQEAHNPVEQDAALPRVLLLGASGTIGRAVADELLGQGKDLTCLLRNTTQGQDTAQRLQPSGAKIVWGEPHDAEPLMEALRGADCVISCLASRSGTPKDAQRVDYEANHRALKAAEAAGVKLFILLSAICVQRPKLAFQHAKLAFEAELIASDMEYVIVRPTAFFKSLSGQAERMCQGKPFLIFGVGTQTACKPISDADCARFMAQCINDPDRHNGIWPIGGPGPAITAREQGAMLCEAMGREPSFRSVPTGVFPVIAKVLGAFSGLSDWCAEKAEYARIAHYYATESMLVFDPETGQYDADATPEFGSDTLAEHYRALAAKNFPR